MKENSNLLVVVGPTAVGKTSLCLGLAQSFDAEIISADSRQLYKELNMGTAKPTPEELILVKHHFINKLSIEEDYDVGKFEVEGLEILQKIFINHHVAILTGGSGLYIKAICEGFDEIPAGSTLIREELILIYQEKGLLFLQKKLAEVDPDYYQEVDLQNPQRLIRALEVYEASGKPYSSFRKNTRSARSFNIIKIGLERERQELYLRIDRRMDEMLEAGLLEEAKQLYPYKHKNALQTVGYQEIFNFLDEKYDLQEAIRLLKRNSRRYAKRQMTWFKKDPEIKWFHPDQWDEILDFIHSKIKL
ncbi:tRNA (adenosine(37)-N6)-dimethylallyltransferase MiaA [soil metagenome]